MAVHGEEVVSVELHLYGSLSLGTQRASLGNRLIANDIGDADHVGDLYIIIIVHVRLGETEVGDHVILVLQDVTYRSRHVLYVHGLVEVRVAIAGVDPCSILDCPARK